MNSMRAPVVVGEHAGEGDQLLRLGQVRRDRPAVVPDVEVELRRREPDRTIGQRDAQQAAHRVDLLRRGGPLRRLVAHHPPPERAVAHIGSHVDADATVEPVEEVGERPTAEGDTLDQRIGRHALDTAEHLQQPPHVVGLGRREGEPAVAGQHSGDAVPRRRRRRRLEVQLGVVVGVDVDEPGGDGQPPGVDDVCGVTVDVADLGDPTVGDGDVGAAAGRPGAVDHDAAADEQIPGHRTTCSRP